MEVGLTTVRAGGKGLCYKHCQGQYDIETENDVSRDDGDNGECVYVCFSGVYEDVFERNLHSLTSDR